MSDFNPNPELCHKYASFASHLGRWQFKVMYWTLFVTNLLVLFFASWAYIKGQEAMERLADQPSKRRKKLWFYILLCLGCTAVSIAVVIMEAFALMALQFCDGEDLMSLYWSTWTMVQVGSLIAIGGIILAMAHTLRDRRHPPWALALGTPVLVIAGLLHLIHDCTKKRVQGLRRKESDGTGSHMSRTPTIIDPAGRDDDPEQGKEEVEGELIGFTIHGGPIVRFTNSTVPSLPVGQSLGQSCDGQPLIAFESGSLQLMRHDDK